MDLRKSSASRSVFYRGITLKDYLHKNSSIHPNLQYKDDETILIDENNHPVIIEDDFIRMQSYTPKHKNTPTSNKNTRYQGLITPKSSLNLPNISSGKHTKTKQDNLMTQRTRTDTTLGSSFELRSSVFPSLEKKIVVRERNITMVSRSSSRETSCRKKFTEIIKQIDQTKQNSISSKNGYLSNRQCDGISKKQMMLKNRYNIRVNPQGQNSKLRYFDRIKSNIE